MRHVYECPIRWADLDVLGHVNNVVYADYLQDARIDLLAAHLPEADPAEGLVVSRQQLDYLAQTMLSRNPVRVECWVSQVRGASFTIAYEVRTETGVQARGRTTLAPVRLDTGSSRRLTPQERELLHRLHEPDDPGFGPRPGSVSRSEVGRLRLPVRFSDLDTNRHVNNVRYFEYFQEGRVRLLEDLVGDGWAVLLASLDVEYREPMLLRPEPYDVWSRIVDTGRTSLVLAAEIASADTVYARGRAVMVTVDPQTGRPQPPSPEVLAALRANLPEH